MIRAGDLTVEQAADHPRRNTLTRAIGVEPDVVVDDWILELTGNDRFLLCTDGVTNELDESDISELLDIDEHPSDVARALVRQANDRGGRDNSTALVVDVDIEGVAHEPTSTQADGLQPDGSTQRTPRRRGWRRPRSR